MIPKEVAEAAEAIRRFEKNDDPDSIKGMDIGNIEKGKSTQINHMELLNALIKFISFVKMPLISKEIMISKLTHPGLTNMEIAMQRGIRLADVILYETEGKQRTVNALNSAQLQDSINKYNRDSKVDAAVQNIKQDVKGGESIQTTSE